MDVIATRRRLGSQTATVVFLAYTAIVWAGRIRNIVSDDELTDGAKSWRLLVAVLFLGRAAAVAVRWRDHTKLLAALCVWTIGYWLVRGTGMLIADESAGFKVVHTALTIGSVGLAVWAWPYRRTLKR
jgi:hypothetical protein